MSLVGEIVKAEKDVEANPDSRQHAMRIMDPVAGDFRVNWDEDDEGSVAAAKETFKAQKAKGLVAYHVGKKGQKTAEVMKDFDPSAEAIIFAPAAVGG